MIKPVSEQWPDAHGNFSMVLPASTRGKTLHFWENRRQFFSRFPAKTGGPVEGKAAELHLRKARLTRISIESNGSICRGMLQHRYDNTRGQGEEDQ